MSSNSNPFGKGAASDGSPRFGRVLAAQNGSVFGNASPQTQSQGPARSYNEPFEEEDTDNGESSESELDPMDFITDEALIIDSIDSYVSIIMEYLKYHDWTATTLIAPLFSLDDDHVLCDFLRVCIVS